MHVLMHSCCWKCFLLLSVHALSAHAGARGMWELFINKGNHESLKPEWLAALVEKLRSKNLEVGGSWLQGEQQHGYGSIHLAWPLAACMMCALSALCWLMPAPTGGQDMRRRHVGAVDQHTCAAGASAAGRCAGAVGDGQVQRTAAVHARRGLEPHFHCGWQVLPQPARQPAGGLGTRVLGRGVARVVHAGNAFNLCTWLTGLIALVRVQANVLGALSVMLVDRQCRKPFIEMEPDYATLFAMASNRPGYSRCAFGQDALPEAQRGKQQCSPGRAVRQQLPLPYHMLVGTLGKRAGARGSQPPSCWRALCSATQRRAVGLCAAVRSSMYWSS